MNRRGAYPRAIRPLAASGGFTLVELLLALTIATLIVGAAASVFVNTVDSYERGDEARQMMQTARTAADVIERHLRCAFSPAQGGGATFQGEDLTVSEVAGHRLTLLSAAPGRFPRAAALSDRAEVTFELDPEGEDEGLWMRIDASPDDEPDAGGYRLPLGDSIRDFQVKYYDGTDWLDEWYENSLPKAVQFSFTVLPEQKDEDAKETQTKDKEEKDQGGLSITRLVWLPLGGDSDTEQSTTSVESTQSSASTSSGGQTNQTNQSNQSNQSKQRPSGGGGGS